jgi:hypothetical protein
VLGEAEELGSADGDGDDVLDEPVLEEVVVEPPPATGPDTNFSGLYWLSEPNW